jgi:glycosyltransferase involved in cell wall biosynthesis
MKILVLNFEFPPLGGGASPVSFDIADMLTENQKNEIDVITMGYKGLPAYQEIKKNFRVHRVKCIRTRKERSSFPELLTYLISAYFKAISLLKKKKFDICHTHFILPSGILALVLKKEFGLPYIITAHGSDVPGYNEERFTFSHKFTKPILRLICREAKRIVTPSSFLNELILKNISRKIGPKLVNIPNGIHVKKFNPDKKTKSIISTGRLFRRKGFETIISALSNQDLGYVLHIIGDGPMIGELKIQAEKSKTKIIFHGWLKNTSSEYLSLLQKGDIYVLASRKENASISLLEAMAAGCAVITTNISGCPETIGEAGLLFEPGDVEGLRNQINFLVSNKKERQTLQKKARKRAEEIFDWNKVIARYEALLQ